MDTDIPHDLQLESAAIGQLLYSPSKAASRVGDLCAEDFLDLRLRIAFEAIKAIVDQGQDPDGNAFYSALRARNIDLGTCAFLNGLADKQGAGWTWEHTVQDLRQFTARRKLLSIAERAVSIAHSNSPLDGQVEGLADEWTKVLQSSSASDQNALPVIACDWLTTEPPPLDPVIEGMFEVGDKLAIIGPSKTRKSFLLLQLAVALAAGVNTLGFVIPKPRRVLVIQLEIQAKHYHRRLRRMAGVLGQAAEDLGDRLQILNLRGRTVDWASINRIVKAGHFEVVLLDPLYKLATGDENAAVDMKPVLARFDAIAQSCNCAVGYVHHDPKSTPSTRAARDRGAGSNVVGRDFDALIALDQHAGIHDGIVLEFLLRNFAPRPNQTAVWIEGCFTLSNEPAIKQKTGARSSANEQEDQLREVVNIASKGLKQRQDFLQLVGARLRIGDKKARGLVALALDKNLIATTQSTGNAWGRVFYGLPDRVCSYEQEQQAKEQSQQNEQPN